MARRLGSEEVVTLQVLASRGVSGRGIARQLGVTEGTVRHQLRKAAQGRPDGRAKIHRAAGWSEPIEAWMAAHGETDRPANVKDLYEHLVGSCAYPGSYRSVLRYVRSRYGRPPMRTYRRVETVPGAQTQTDWGEYPAVDLGEGPEALSTFVMMLSHSRMTAVIWSRSHDEVSWLACHNEAYRRLGGIAAVNRIDNVKTAIVRGSGAWGVIHPTYRAYARSLRFHVDACAPREPQAKGKVEAKVRLSRLLLDLVGRVFMGGIDELQRETDARIGQWARRALCPATGTTVHEAWEAEQRLLAPLPILPEPFDVTVRRPVHKDCMVHFEQHQYPVPFRFVGRSVEVRGCARTVQILADGQVLREYPRHTAARILIDESCYEGQATERVVPPPRLGKMGRRLAQIYAQPVEQRPVDLYAALAEVAR